MVRCGFLRIDGSEFADQAMLTRLSVAKCNVYMVVCDNPLSIEDELPTSYSAELLAYTATPSKRFEFEIDYVGFTMCLLALVQQYTCELIRVALKLHICTRWQRS